MERFVSRLIRNSRIITEFMKQVIEMAVASERYVHFLLDLAGRPPQRCRVSLRALATLEGTCPTTTQLAHSTGLFLKHRRAIEATARMKLSDAKEKEPPKWVTVAAEDLDLTH
jgi:hypothetical protein